MTSLLVVDDELLMQRSLQRVLPRHGFEVDCVATGAEALGRAIGDFVEVILLDWHLQEGDGLEICERLRSLGYLGVIILVTGDWSLETELRVLRLGADDFITKPFEIALLVARARASLRRRSSNIVVKLGRLTVDLTARAAFVDGKRLQLTGLETDLLAYLAVRPGEVVTWAELRNDVWQQTHMSDLTTMRVRVAGPRQKMGTARDLVETVRGVGLRLVG